MEYRRLTAADLLCTLRMNEDFRPGFLCRDNALAFLRDERCWLFAALEGERVIGFAYGYQLRRLNDIGDMLYIHEVGVREDRQRQGIGYALLTALKAECRNHGFCRFFLITSENNEGANALYRKAGGELSMDSGGSDVGWFFQTK